MTHKQTFAEMHSDHRQWASEHSMWSDDLELWCSQYESALAEVKKLEDMMRQHGEGLDAHSQIISRIQHSLEDHERSMAAYQRDGSGAEGQEGMCANHAQQADRHNHQREAHERIKRNHHTMMAHLTMLKAAIEANMKLS